MTIYKRFRGLIFLSVILFWCNSGCHSSSTNSSGSTSSNISSDSDQWYAYDSQIELSGTIVNKVVYGPPDYGEPPKKNEEMKIYVLRLSNPINVKGDKANPNSTDQDDFTGVEEIQIQEFNFKISLERFLNQKVVVKGELYEASAGAEFTDVLMAPSSIELKK